MEWKFDKENFCTFGLEASTVKKRQPTRRAPDARDCPEGVQQSQAFSYALSFFWLDGFAKVQVTGRVSPIGDEPQTVRHLAI